MQGCTEPDHPEPGCATATIREVPGLRPIIAAIGEKIEGPLATIREAIGAPMGAASQADPHLRTALAMCDDVSQLTRRYLDFIDQVEALPVPRPSAERPDELLGEIDRRIMPEAFGRGVAWSCAPEGPIRPLRTDRALFLEALMEWASMAVDSARPGDCVSLVSANDTARADRIRLTLSSSAEEVVAELSNLREDPLFSRLVCLEEVGSDPGSRLALSLERLDLLGVEVGFDAPNGGAIRAVHFWLPAASPARG